jgi:hypothetical protein
VETHIILQGLIKINKPAVVKYHTPFLLSESKSIQIRAYGPHWHLFSHTVNWAIIDNDMNTDSQNTKFFKG